MDQKIFNQGTGYAQQCREYNPIATGQSQIIADNETFEEDIECDSCIHFHHDACEIYQRESRQDLF